MAKLATLNCLFFLIVVSSASAQKVKYKDIYALLSTKQYESAEPFLNRYIRETTDNPNAYLYKGIIFQEKASKDDVLRQPSRMLAHIDSAIFFYDRAYKGITEKEIKKNSEYYAMYNRRDLRTGEFGVTLSDIQYDLEKRMEGLRERKDRIRMVTHYFQLADTLYRKSQDLYASLRQDYPGERELCLRADEQLVGKLTALGVRFDSCVKAFDQYRSAIAVMGKTAYNQTLEGQVIANYASDGVGLPDLYAAKVVLWDYSAFAGRIRRVIESDIFPMRQHLVSYDEEINKLREKLLTENVSVRSDLSTLTDNALMDQLKKYDKRALPADLFTLKIADLEYRSLVIENKGRADTISLHTRVDMTRSALAQARRLDSLSVLLSKRDLDSLGLDYARLVSDTYTSVSVVKTFVQATAGFAAAAKLQQEAKLARLTESMRWIVAGSDSIPLFVGTVHTKFRPLIVVDERYTAGLHYADSLSPAGYLYSINATRIPEVKVTFPVEKSSFREGRLASSRALSYADAADHLYYVLIYSDVPDKDSQIDATLAKIYKADGLAWSTNYKLAFVPKELQFANATGDVSIVGDNGQKTVIDKAGKQLTIDN